MWSCCYFEGSVALCSTKAYTLSGFPLIPALDARPGTEQALWHALAMEMKELTPQELTLPQGLLLEDARIAWMHLSGRLGPG